MCDGCGYAECIVTPDHDPITGQETPVTITAELALEAIRRLSAAGERLENLLEDVVNQSCHVEDGDRKYHLDSMSLRAFAEAMRALAEMGRLKITSEYGRRVIGEWIDAPAKARGIA